MYKQDTDIYTCAGALASVDLALCLIEEDLGTAVAGEIATCVLLHFRRHGNSLQISHTLRAQKVSLDPITRLLTWLPDNLAGDLCARSLAKRDAMSPRNFARIFRQQLGTTPARYTEALRFEVAQRELSNPYQTIAIVVELSGVGSAETLRRLFLRRLGTTPGAFRKGLRASPSCFIEH